MKVVCDREKLLGAFQTVAAIAPARSPKPILQNVKIDATSDRVTLTATDLEIGIRHVVEGVEVQTPGAALLSVARFGSSLGERCGGSRNTSWQGPPAGLGTAPNHTGSGRREL